MQAISNILAENYSCVSSSIPPVEEEPVPPWRHMLLVVRLVVMDHPNPGCELREHAPSRVAQQFGNDDVRLKPFRFPVCVKEREPPSGGDRTAEQYCLVMAWLVGLKMKVRCDQHDFGAEALKILDMYPRH